MSVDWNQDHKPGLASWAAIRTGGTNAVISVELFDINGRNTEVPGHTGPVELTVTSTAKSLATLFTDAGKTLPVIGRNAGNAWWARVWVKSGGGIAANYGAADADTMPTVNTPTQFAVGDVFDMGKVPAL